VKQDDGKKSKKSKKSGEVVVHKSKQVRRKRNGPKSSLQAICRAISISTRPDITKGLLFPGYGINARPRKNDD